jgi:hypothetical protein
MALTGIVINRPSPTRSRRGVDPDQREREEEHRARLGGDRTEAERMPSTAESSRSMTNCSVHR